MQSYLMNESVEIRRIPLLAEAEDLSWADNQKCQATVDEK